MRRLVSFVAGLAGGLVFVKVYVIGGPWAAPVLVECLAAVWLGWPLWVPMIAVFLHLHASDAPPSGESPRVVLYLLFVFGLAAVVLGAVVGLSRVSLHDYFRGCLLGG